MTDEQIISGLSSIIGDLSLIISELKLKDGIISTEILDLLDDINRLSVEI